MSIVSNTSADNVNNANAVFASFLAKHGTLPHPAKAAEEDPKDDDPNAIQAVEDSKDVEEEAEDEEEEEEVEEEVSMPVLLFQWICTEVLIYLVP